jgi:thymidylate synthase (FAD)
MAEKELLPIHQNRYTVLDKGYIDFLEQFGNELTIVNAARVSFGNYHDTWESKDKGLLKYLWVNKHMSPFRHVILRMRIHAPEVVMRQLYKHVVGIEATSGESSLKDHAWNEISGRYKEVEEYHKPQVWRAQSEDNKQASKGEIDDQVMADILYEETLDDIIKCYYDLLDLGVAREQARLILPLSQYTTVIWTVSLQAVLNFIDLRDHDHAQYEIREYAKIMKTYIENNFPILSDIWKA